MEDQFCFNSLTTYFPIVYKFVLDALKVESYQELPKYIWSYQHNIIQEFEQQFFKAIQYTLTNYSDKCDRSVQLQMRGERTFWVNRIVPMFQPLGDQIGLIGYKWCETSLKECVDDSINMDVWMKMSRQFLDGLGFDKCFSELLSMESSSGLEKENIQHTMDDTLKNLSTTITFINGTARQHLDASFSAFQKVQVFSIQTIKQTIALSSTGVDLTKVGHYYHIERRKAEIPITFAERCNWIRLMELLAALTIMISEQTRVMNQLK